jgi:hypothetical protein
MKMGTPDLFCMGNVESDLKYLKLKLWSQWEENGKANFFKDHRCRELDISRQKFHLLL